MQAFVEPLLANSYQILAREGRKAAYLWVRPGKHDAHELRLLLSIELRRASSTRQVGQPIQPMLVVADDPVTQRLAVHARRLRRVLSAHAIERVGDRQHAPGDARIAFGLRQLAQHPRRAVAPDE